MRSLLHNVNVITANILPQNAEWLATIRILHSIAYENHQCTNPFIMRSVLHNVKATNADITGIE